MKGQVIFIPFEKVRNVFMSLDVKPVDVSSSAQLVLVDVCNLSMCLLLIWLGQDSQLCKKHILTL